MLSLIAAVVMAAPAAASLRLPASAVPRLSPVRAQPLPDGRRALGADPLKALNRAVSEVLKPFNNERTKTAVRFRSLRTGQDRVIAAAASADYSKTDGKNTLSIQLRGHYKHPEGPKALPVAGFAGRAAIPSSLKAQREFNKLILAAEAMAQAWPQSWERKYGPAAAAEARVLEKVVDSNGDLQRLKLQLTASVDLSKLPPTVDPKTVEILGLRVLLVGTSQGPQLTIKATLNPDANGFSDAELKALVDKLLAQDPAAIESLRSKIAWLDQFAAFFLQKASDERDPEARAIAVMERHKDRILAIPGVVGVGYAPRYRAIKVNFETREALEAAQRAGQAPAEIEGVPIRYDVTGIPRPA